MSASLAAMARQCTAVFRPGLTNIDGNVMT
jgi:hypothetical protein